MWSTKKLVPYVMLVSLEIVTASTSTFFPDTNLWLTQAMLVGLLKDATTAIVMAVLPR